MAKKEKSEWISWVKALIVALLFVWVLQTFVIIPIEIEGISMAPTLNDQDYLLVEKISYHFFNPQRFDIIIFQATENKDYIKRIIGLPGETIEYRDDQLLVNGEYVEEPFLQDYLASDQSDSPYTEDLKLAEDIPGQHQSIPEGYYLVLGDNRQDSTDSRMIGLIAEDDILGKARFIYWPFGRMGSVN